MIGTLQTTFPPFPLPDPTSIKPTILTPHFSNPLSCVSQRVRESERQRARHRQQTLKETRQTHIQKCTYSINSKKISTSYRVSSVSHPIPIQTIQEKQSPKVTSARLPPLFLLPQTRKHRKTPRKCEPGRRGNLDRTMPCNAMPCRAMQENQTKRKEKKRKEGRRKEARKTAEAEDEADTASGAEENPKPHHTIPHQSLSLTLPKAGV